VGLEGAFGVGAGGGFGWGGDWCALIGGRKSGIPWLIKTGVHLDPYVRIWLKGGAKDPTKRFLRIS